MTAIAQIPINVPAGKDCYAYGNSGNHASPTWQLCDNIQDVKIARPRTLSNLKLRANRPHETNVPTLMALNPTFKVPHIQSDTLFTALSSAEQNGTAIDMVFLDGVVAPANNTLTSEGWRGDWVVEKFDEDQSSENADMHDVSLKPGQTGNAPSFFSVTGS